jgi:hypothetical protein
MVPSLPAASKALEDDQNRISVIRKEAVLQIGQFLAAAIEIVDGVLLEDAVTRFRKFTRAGPSGVAAA